MANETNGTKIGLYVATALVAGAQSHEISFSSNMIEKTSKDSGGDAEYMAGLRSATISVEALYMNKDGASAYNQEDLFTIYNDRSEVVLKWGELTGATGESQYTATALISSLGYSAGMEDVVTYSAEFQVTGAVTRAAIS